MAISMLKIRRPLGRLIFNMGIAIPGKTVFLIETAPCILRIPPTAPWLYPYYWLVHIGSQVKTRQNQSYKFKEFAKTSNFRILKKKKPLHMTHLLKLLDEMYKYKMDPTSIVEDTEWTLFCPQIDKQTDRQSRWNQYTHLQLCWAGV